MTRGYVYRVLDDEKAVIYIGSSTNVDRRVNEHRRTASWWPEAKWVEEEHYSTIAEARVAEVVAIRSELPRHNRKHLPSEPRWVNWSTSDLDAEWERLVVRRAKAVRQVDRLDAEIEAIEETIEAAAVAERAS